MLVLARFEGQRIIIGDDIVITIVDAKGRVKVGVEAPKHVPVNREEVLDNLWRDLGGEG